ncbi:MAG: hypothetical protein Q9208_008067 [Pyrenodesmia sp. 3 TL-2023]
MTQQVEALLTEHFRYTPLSLIDDIINTVNTIIYRAIEAIENGLFSIPPQQLGYSPEPETSGNAVLPDADHPDSKDEIENGCHQLETLLEATVDKTFDKFEIYTLRNILTGLSLPLPSNTPTPESIFALRRKVQETRKLNLALRNTHTRNAATVTQLKSLLSAPSSISSTSPQSSTTDPSLAFLTTHPSATIFGLSLTQTSDAKFPLSENAQLFISQLPALRQALEELKPRLKTLPEKIGDVDWESRREERRVYIEGRVRKVVGATGGAGGDGDVMKGVRVGREEVRDLEGVVGGIARVDRMEE